MARAKPADDRPNAATRAIANATSHCCGAGTELKKLDRARQQFDIALGQKVDEIGYTGDEVVAVCRDCKNAVDVICR